MSAIDRLSSSQKKLVWEKVSKLRKAEAIKVCLFPGCAQPLAACRSHSISQKAGLATIAREGHVYDLHQDPGDYVRADGAITPTLRGIDKVSTFPGFCSKHDNNTFLVLDQTEFQPDSEYLFLLFYRAFCREFHQKLVSLAELPDAIEIAAIHPNLPVELIRAHIENQRIEFQFSAFKCGQVKRVADELLTSKHFAEVDHLVFRFQEPPSILCASSFSAGADLRGNQLELDTNFFAMPPVATVNIVPASNGGAVVFSWLKHGAETPANLCLGFSQLRPDTVCSVLVRFLFGCCENIAIKPDWWETLPPAVRSELVRLANWGRNKSRRLDFVQGGTFCDWRITQVQSQFQ